MSPTSGASPPSCWNSPESLDMPHERFSSYD